MADRIVTSTPRQAEYIEEDEDESEDFVGFEQLTGKYREMEDEMSSIDNSFCERDTILQVEGNNTRDGEDSGIIFNRMGRRKGKEKKAKERKTKEEEDTKGSKESKRKKEKKITKIKANQGSRCSSGKKYKR